MTEKVKQIIEDSLPITFKASQAAEEIAQMFCDEVVRIEKYGDNHLGLSVRLMLKQMGFTEQQIINSLEKLKAK